MASSTFSPPRIPVSQSWTIATRFADWILAIGDWLDVLRSSAADREPPTAIRHPLLTLPSPHRISRAPAVPTVPTKTPAPGGGRAVAGLPGDRNPSTRVESPARSRSDPAD